MPTAMAVLPNGRLAFTSLKGHVFLTRDDDGDGLDDSLTLFAEGLAAPFGILPHGEEFYVAHKPEVVAVQYRWRWPIRCDEGHRDRMGLHR